MPIVVALEAFAEAQALAVPKPPSEEALAVKAAERPLNDALQPLREADFTLAAEPDRFTLATEAGLTVFQVIASRNGFSPTPMRP